MNTDKQVRRETFRYGQHCIDHETVRSAIHCESGRFRTTIYTLTGLSLKAWKKVAEYTLKHGPGGLEHCTKTLDEFKKK